MIMVKLVKVISEEKIFVIFHRLKQDDGNKVMRTAHLHNIITQVYHVRNYQHFIAK